jgi:hypothetical protein
MDRVGSRHSVLICPTVTEKFDLRGSRTKRFRSAGGVLTPLKIVKSSAAATSATSLNTGERQADVISLFLGLHQPVKTHRGHPAFAGVLLPPPSRSHD